MTLTDLRTKLERNLTYIHGAEVPVGSKEFSEALLCILDYLAEVENRSKPLGPQAVNPDYTDADLTQDIMRAAGIPWEKTK